MRNGHTEFSLTSAESEHSLMPASFGRAAGALALALACSAASAKEDGKYLTILGDCAGCHTNTGRPPSAGGRALTSPFGTFYTDAYQRRSRATKAFGDGGVDVLV